MGIKENRIFFIGHLVALGIILFLFWDTKKGRNGNDFKSLAELTFISGTVDNQLKSDVAEQGGPYVQLKLKEFPGFKFDVLEAKYNALNAVEFVNEVNKNDSVRLGILTYDFDTKIRRSKSARMTERFINYSLIEPYEIKAKGKTYMTIENVNSALKHDRSLSWVLYLLGGFYLLFMVLVLTGIIKRNDTNEG